MEAAAGGGLMERESEREGRISFDGPTTHTILLCESE